MYRFGFTCEVHDLRHGHLHSACEFVARHASSEIGIAGKLLQMLAIESLQQVDGGTIIGSVETGRARKI